ncbi:MAG: potassium channel family protein, partial [Ignavibacteriaceae bacterium]
MKKQTIDPGLGEKYSSKTKRVINTDGSFNVQKKGIQLNPKDLYQYLINISWTKFFLLVLLLYLTFNAIFAAAYILTGSEHLVNAGGKSGLEAFSSAFFFSVQTFTTVGYGKVTPEGFLANVISSLEAMTGLMTFALITGLLYGRFSRPSSRILYSRNAI